MPTLTEQLDTAVGAIKPAFGADDVRRRVSIRRRRRWMMRGVAAAVAVAVTATAVSLSSSGDDRGVIATTSERRVFSTRTNTVLAFDDGYDGITLVDLDRSRAVRRVIEGQRAGDQPYRLIRAGDVLVVGWSDVHIAPLDGGPSRRLKGATIAFPAPSTGEKVWIDKAGIRLNDRTPTFELVDTEGVVLVSAGEAPAEINALMASPGIGVPAIGIAFETSAGVRIWHPEEQRVTALGTQSAFVGDLFANVLVWCEGSCTQLHMTRLGVNNEDRVITAPNGASFDVRSSKFSPDGDSLAVMASTTLMLINVPSAMTYAFIGDVPEYSYLGWSNDSHQVFFSSSSHMERSTELGRYDVRGHDVERRSLPLGQALGFVSLTRHEAEALMRADRRKPRSCPPPTIQPSGRTNVCGFRFEAERSTTG